MARTVLVADDSPTIQNKAKGILTGEGLEVVTVSNGVAAIKKLPQVKPLLILADVAMPGRDGYEVCQFVKSSPDLSHIPVVLIFSDADPYNEDQGTKVHADGRIKKMAAGKPFDPEELISTVSSFLAKAEAPNPSAVDTVVPTLQPTMVTEPVDEEPKARVKKSLDLSSLPQGVAFAEPGTEEPAHPMMDLPGPAAPSPPEPISAFGAHSSTESPGLAAEDTPPASEQEAPPQRTVLFRRPSDIAEPMLSDELAQPEPPPPPTPAAPEPEHSPLSASSLGSFSLSDAAAGEVRFASPEAEVGHERLSPPAEAPPETEVVASPFAGAVADAALVYTIVQKAVRKMSPPALSLATIEEVARRIADEIVIELDSESQGG